MSIATDTAYLEQRRHEEEREFLISAQNPERAPRLAPMYAAIYDMVRNGPAPWNAVIAGAARNSDVKVKTIDNAVRILVRQGFLIRTGAYSSHYSRKARRRITSDTRALRLGDWITYQESVA